MFKKWFLSIFIAVFLASSLAFAADKVNVNTASLEQLQSLNGVGASTATAIIAYREKNGTFKQVADLVNVKGIGGKKLEKLADQISVADPKK